MSIQELMLDDEEDKDLYKEEPTIFEVKKQEKLKDQNFLAGFRGPREAWNPNGRPKRTELMDVPTNRELKERELLMLLRKFRPHVAEAVIAAARVMKNDKAADQNKLKAADLILRNYHKLVLDLYANGAQEDDEGKEIQQQNAPVFSLRVIGTDDALNDVEDKKDV